MSVFLTNNELEAFAKNGIGGIAIKNTVDAYRSQGLSDDAIRAKIDAKLTDFAKAQYGAENVDKARTAVKETRENLPSNTLLDNMLTKEALAAGAKGGMVFGERMLNGATIGGYDWLNDKLGGNAKSRYADVVNEAERAGWGLPMKAVMIGGDVLGGVASPIAKGLVTRTGSIASGIGNNFVRNVAQSGLGGAAFGGVRSAFDSDFDLKDTAKGALIGGAIGAAIPTAQEGIKLAKRGVKNVVHAGRNAIDKLTRGALSPSAEDMAAGASEIAGALPDNGEIAGTAIKNLSDDITKGVKAKATALYDKAEQLAAGRPVVLDKNSHFAKEFNKMASSATKSGRTELNKVWNEVGHTKYDAPTYETAKSFRSWLSEKSATGGTGLTKKQYGDLLAALDKDIESSLGSKAAAAKKTADAFYRNEMGNPDSITNSVNKMLRKDPISVVGNRGVASAQGKAWKASPLQKMLEEGEKIGSPYVADVKQALQANTTTRAQFNRMSPAQKQMVYGDKLAAAEKNFNGGLLNWAEKAAEKTTDVVLTPVQKVLDALNPIPTVQGAFAGARLNKQLKNLENGRPVSTIPIVTLSRRDAKKVNEIPGLAETAKITDNRKFVADPDDVSHLYQRRVKDGKMSTEDVARLLTQVLYSPNKTITSSGNRNSFMVANPKAVGYSILVPNKNNTGVNHIDTVVKTRNSQRVDNVIKRNLNRKDGLDSPSSSSQKGSASASRLSALQPVLNKDYKPEQSDVKRIQMIMAIINALKAQ